ncbi:hypothetical protein [Lacipirellula parvula]|uniref:hypothetical protein n=1 Tax=Lacipirellula parvula TaxID=2650471 RepID=UPI0012607492|nr:hypothetical protein [Lacipirellula parvula]
MESALTAHDRALTEQATAIFQYDELLSKEEHIVAVKQGDCDEQPPFADHHAHEVTVHQVQEERHERVKRHHRAVMLQWLKLMKALESPM